jgi:hypothetical protein
MKTLSQGGVNLTQSTLGDDVVITQSSLNNRVNTAINRDRDRSLLTNAKTSALVKFRNPLSLSLSLSLSAL